MKVNPQKKSQKVRVSPAYNKVFTVHYVWYALDGLFWLNLYEEKANYYLSLGALVFEGLYRWFVHLRSNWCLNSIIKVSLVIARKYQNRTRKACMINTSLGQKIENRYFLPGLYWKNIHPCKNGNHAEEIQGGTRIYGRF